jgi:NAD(P)-dependent dehydrogenase (short-subunit alcohol dehydrogenase family)
MAIPRLMPACGCLIWTDREDDKVTDKKIWFITGAGRGMGVDIAKAAVAAAVERSGRIDVLVNNAGNFYAGFFEEISPRTSGLRSRRPCSARSTSPAPSCR